MRILNRIITWTDNGIQYEGDQRHVEIAMRELGLDEGSREVGVPIVKDEDDKESNIELDKSAAKQYRGIIARMNYLGQDRSQIQFAIQELRHGKARGKGRRKIGDIDTTHERKYEIHRS